jgi:hypothetical protein
LWRIAAVVGESGEAASDQLTNGRTGEGLACEVYCGRCGICGRRAGLAGRVRMASRIWSSLANRSRTRRATGSSIDEPMDFTYSPMLLMNLNNSKLSTPVES